MKYFIQKLSKEQFQYHLTACTHADNLILFLAKEISFQQCFRWNENNYKLALAKPNINRDLRAKLRKNMNISRFQSNILVKIIFA